MRRFLIAFCKNEKGATAIEYGLIAAGIAIVLIPVVNALGGSLNTTLTTLSTAINP